jgi:hypothetical protein
LQSALSLALAAFALAGCRQGGATLALDISLDPPDLAVTAVHIEVRQQLRSIVEREFTWMPGQGQIGVFLPSGVGGTVLARGRGFDSAGQMIAIGSAEGTVTPGQVSAPLALVLKPTTVSPLDGGAPDGPPPVDGPPATDGPPPADGLPLADGPLRDGPPSDAPPPDAAPTEVAPADRPPPDAPPEGPPPDSAPDAPPDVGMPACGNGVIEAPGETCDPPTMCRAQETACQHDAAMVRVPSGDPASCTFRCLATARPCGPADTFCPPGCTGPQDFDCRKELGASCAVGPDCSSGICADGKCCNDACTAPCQSCATGMCQPVRSGPDPECAFGQTCDATGACVPPPAEVPRPLRPWNGEATGSVHRDPALRPRFLWGAVAAAAFYRIEIDDSCSVPGFASCTFPSPEVQTRVDETSFRPATALPVATMAPVGRRYFWRVRACNVAGCSAWSPVRYVDVGRQRKDFNGDGYADALFAAHASLRVVLGGSNIGSTPDFAVEHPPATGFDFVGLAAVGDVNGDGFGDFAAGVSVNGSSRYARLYLGGASLDSGVDQTFHLEPMTIPEYGDAITGGDVDGDGFSDIAVGAFGDVFKGSHAYLYRGGSSIGFTEAATYTYEDGTVRATSIDLSGDVNGDGYADLLFSSPLEARVYLGGPQLDTFSDLRTDHPAQRIASVGDVDGDGYGDYLTYGGPSPTLFRGARLLTGTPAIILDRDAQEAGGGDIDGDGYPDLVTSTFNGPAHVYIGGPTMDGRPDVTLMNPNATELFGWGVSVVGDMRGDGFGVVSVGAPDHDSAAYAGGRVYLFFGGAPMDTMADRLITGTVAEEAWGQKVAFRAPLRRGPLRR